MIPYAALVCNVINERNALHACGVLSAGVLANAIFPTWLITFLLIFLLLYITFLAARKVITLHRAEQRAATASEQLLKAQPIAPAYDDKEADTQHLLSDISVHPTESIDMDQHVLGGMQGTSFEPDSSKHAIAAKLSDKPGLQQSRSGMLSGIYANLLRYSMDSMQSSGSQLTCTGSDAWSTELSSTPRQQRSYLSQGSLSLSQLEEHQPMGSPDRDQCAASPGGDDSDLAQPPICPDDHLQHAAQDQPADHVDACPHDHRQQQPIPMPGAAQADQHQHRRGRGQVCCGGSAMQPSMADEYMQPSASAQCTQPTSGMIEHSGDTSWQAASESQHINQFGAGMMRISMAASFCDLAAAHIWAAPWTKLTMRNLPHRQHGC